MFDPNSYSVTPCNKDRDFIERNTKVRFENGTEIHTLKTMGLDDYLKALKILSKHPHTASLYPGLETPEKLTQAIATTENEIQKKQKDISEACDEDIAEEKAKVENMGMHYVGQLGNITFASFN